MSTKSDRRDFVQAGLAGAALLAAGLNLRAADTKKPKLNKAVKYAMIGAGKTVKEKFELIKKLGFQGVEIDSPSGIDRVEMLLAQEQTGIKVHGAIDSVHWGTPLSSPDAAVRAKGLASLKVALHDASFFGADTVLLVPGVARDGVTYEQCWERSQAEVRKALPVAEKRGVKIACEVVWNDFITKPEQMIEYVDLFKPTSSASATAPAAPRRSTCPAVSRTNQMTLRAMRCRIGGRPPLGPTAFSGGR